MGNVGPSQQPYAPSLERRRLLQALVGMSLAVPCGSLTGAIGLASAQSSDPRATRPQAGDQLVFASGDRVGTAITLEDVPLGTLVTAYPMDPKTRLVRDGSRLNQILLLRLRVDELTEETRARAAQGVVAYSGVCTHAACDVTWWKAETKVLRCPCHESEFDPKADGHVSGGPAPRRLPALPIDIVDGVLTAKGGFSGRVGFQSSP